MMKKKKKIKLGLNFSSFLIPQSDVFTLSSVSANEADLVKYKGENCWIAKVNWITYEVVIVANNIKFIEYEPKNLQWLW